MEILQYKNIRYVRSLPADYTPNGRYPLLIFLHGAGSRGDDIRLLLQNPFFVEAKDHISGFVTVAPQCGADNWFSVFEQLHEFICHVIADKNVDPSKCTLMGASMGGYAVWQEAMSYPELYAAIVPICGGGMYWNAGRLCGVKIKAFHGAEDKVVRPEESQKMVDAVNGCGGDAELTVFDGVGHNSWLPVYRDETVFQWLLSQRKGSASEDRLCRDPETFG